MNRRACGCGARMSVGVFGSVFFFVVMDKQATRNSGRESFFVQQLIRVEIEDGGRKAKV